MDVTYYIPLSYALKFRRLRFGRAEIREFTESELSTAWRIDELLGHGPAFVPDTRALCQFQFLVVRGDARSDRWTPPGTLTFPFNFHPDNLERVAVYERHFPPVVDRAIFCLLLQPIEDAVHYGLDWRPFETPVLYVRHDDPAQRPRLPPDPSKLNWEPCFTEDGEEYERPLTRGECDRAGLEQDLRNTWHLLERLLPRNGSCQSAVNPVAERFVLRAYQQGRFDGLIMHMIALDALLGKSQRNATKMTMKRLTNLLHATCRENLFMDESARFLDERKTRNQSSGKWFWHLYGLRNRFVHGKMNEPDDVVRGVDPFVQDLIVAHILTRSAFIAALYYNHESGICSRDELLDALD